jgi:hypothetical protein
MATHINWGGGVYMEPFPMTAKKVGLFHLFYHNKIHYNEVILLFNLSLGKEDSISTCNIYAIFHILFGSSVGMSWLYFKIFGNLHSK